MLRCARKQARQNLEALEDMREKGMQKCLNVLISIIILSLIHQYRFMKLVEKI